MVAAIRWCYLGTGRCVWHNLKLEIAVSISPHSVATRSTDNKSSLILLKISRECSGSWDEDREQEEIGGGESQDEEEEEERVSDGKETEAKWGRENREKADWLAKQTPKNNSETLKCLHGEKVSPVF